MGIPKYCTVQKHLSLGGCEPRYRAPSTLWLIMFFEYERFTSKDQAPRDEGALDETVTMCKGVDQNLPDQAEKWKYTGFFRFALALDFAITCAVLADLTSSHQMCCMLFLVGKTDASRAKTLFTHTAWDAKTP